MLDHSIPHNFVIAPLKSAANHHLDTSKLLIQAGIPEDVEKNPQARVTARQYAELLRLIWTALDDEHMGFGSRQMRLGSFAMMCKAIIHCHTLEKALYRASEFQSMFFDVPGLEVLAGPEQIELRINDKVLNDPDHFCTESLLVIWHRLSSWLIGTQVPLIKVCCAYPAPEHHKEYRSLFAAPVEFDTQFTGLVFAPKYMSAPIVQDEAKLKHFLRHSPADLLARPNDNQTVVGQIRRMIGRDLSQELPSLETVADALHMSPQTLRRRLKDEGTSYQKLKDQLRRDMALYYLDQPDITIQGISEKLGFAEPSTFHRAFKKWTGMTPGDYRSQDQRSHDQDEESFD